MSKSMFRTKTFWFNVVAGIVEFLPFVTQLYPEIDPRIFTIAVIGGNIIIRRWTKTEVHVVTPRETD